MKKTEVIAIAILSILAHLGTLLRQFPMGYDPYFYLTPGLAKAAGYPPLFSIIQDSIFANPWLSAMTFTFIFSILTYKIASCLHVKRPWLSAVLLFTAPMFIFRTALLEDDLLGFTFAMMFLLIYLNLESTPIRNIITKLTVLLGSIACYFGVWRGMLLYILSFIVAELSIYNKKSRYMAALIAIAITISTLFIATTLTGEAALGIFYFIPGLGILSLGVLHPFLKKHHPHTTFMTLAFMFLGLALAQARFIWLFTPFAAILVTHHWGDWLFKKEWRIAILSVALVFGLAYGAIGVYTEQPSPQTILDIQEVANITGNVTIANEWQYGHWLNWAGAKPMYTNLNPRELIIPDNATFVLARHKTNLTLPLEKNLTSFALYRAQPVPLQAQL